MSAAIIYGIHAIAQLLKSDANRVRHIYLLKGRHDKKIESLLTEIAAQGIAYTYVSRETLDKLSAFANHQGILAECIKSKTYDEQDLLSLLAAASTPPLLLILDGVQDPHNLGACFRVADAFNAQAIIAPKDKAVGVTAVVSKVASGATETIPFIAVTNLARTLKQLKAAGIWIYGADHAGANSILQTNLTGPIALVLGAEGKGLRRLTKECCDALIHIPMLGSVQSLNVAVAAGIMLYEVTRQRQQ